MAKRIRKRRCKNCHIFFLPDHRNAWHQEYCSQPECRKASKATSRQRWLGQEENRDHFHGPENVHRVQQWRKAHPGYWRRKPPKGQEPLQDLLSQKIVENSGVETSLTKEPLQDLLDSQPMVLIGLIAHLTGSALQDDIALTARRVQQLGSDILKGPTPIKACPELVEGEEAMIQKHPICPQRIRKVPSQFSSRGSPSGP